MHNNTLYQTTLLYTIERYGCVPHNTTVLPWNIHDDIMAYGFNYCNVRIFHTSISKRHFQIADKYHSKLGRMGNVRQNAINSALRYAIDDNQFEYLYKLGLTNFNEGIICAIKLDDTNIINRYINVGFNDWNFALIQSVTYGNTNMMEYFISKGASNFNGALVEAIKTNNDMLIEFFINKGAGKSDIVFAAAFEHGSKELMSRLTRIAYYELLDYMTADEVGILLHIEYYEFIDLLICKLLVDEYDKFYVPVMMGKSLMCLQKGMQLKMFDGKIISKDLFPLLTSGYGLYISFFMLMMLYIISEKLYDPTNTRFKFDRLIYDAFAKIPAVRERHSTSNINNLTTLQILNVINDGPIHLIYDMVFLNTKQGDNHDIKDANFLSCPTTLRQLDKERVMLKGILAKWSSYSHMHIQSFFEDY